MNAILDITDYESISEIVRQQLRSLIPDNEYTQSEQLVFGPEFMAKPLRISTPSTNFNFDSAQKKYLQGIRNQIKESNFTSEERLLKNKQIDSIILFGQLLFAQSASLHFLKNSFIDKSEEDISAIELQMEQLIILVQGEGIQFDSSRFDALTRRKKFNDQLNVLKQTINGFALKPEEKQQLLARLEKAKDFYYQANDFNFEYANKPSRCFSTFVNSCELYGSRISLVASVIAIGASALSLIPYLTPIVAPVALAATVITVAINMPIALKNVGRMLYNLIKFQASPTPEELINTTLLGTSLLLAGVGGVVGQAVSSGVLSANAEIITKAFIAVNDVTKISAGTAGQYQTASKEPRITFYKSELFRLKPKAPSDQANALEDSMIAEHSKGKQSFIPGFS